MDEFLYLSARLLENQKKKEKVDLNSFYLLRVIGKGSYAKVILVAISSIFDRNPLKLFGFELPIPR